MLDHNDVRHKLSEYIDGSITDQEKTAIAEHLKTCSACSDALTELRKTIEQVKTIEEVEPPAWMTQKIMAKVRSEAIEKKSLFQRLFFPLSVKLPIQAVTVLFLTVTAFYIYRNIQPAPTPSEAPMQEYAAKKEAPQAAAPAGEQTISPEPPARAKKVPQAPEYKALDMKLEYEKPAPPVPMDEAAPAPAKPAEQHGAEFAKGQMKAPRADAPLKKQEQGALEPMMLSRQKAVTAESAGAAEPRPLGKTERKDVGVTVKISEVTATGGLTKDAVRMAVERQIKSLRSCIPTTQPGAKIKIKVIIDASGRVKNVEIVSKEITDKAVEQCLRRVMNGWRFDANSAGKETDAMITFQTGS